ncbi:hypothetical protein L3Q67_42130 [Saccharothrix sp. AJ9571]|nr:hypothetical protein L3Q67_42130 [Saccharothrix sp. AJ9571]
MNLFAEILAVALLALVLAVRALLRAASLPFLLFVLALGVVVGPLWTTDSPTACGA